MFFATKERKAGVAVAVLIAAWCFSFVLFTPIVNDYKKTWHVFLTGSTVKFAKHWQASNPLHSMFAMTECPPSIETPNLASQEVYASYPPGAVLPVWGLAAIAGVSPEIAFVRSWNLLLQLGIALCVFGIVWNCLRSFSRNAAFFGALFGGFFYLLTKTPSTIHYSSYFADQAVIFPVVFLFWYETSGKSKIILPFVVLANLWGSLTDPFFYFAAGMLLLFRMAQSVKNKRFRKDLAGTAYIWGPMVLGLVFFAVQIVYLGHAERLINVFFHRLRGPMDDNPAQPASIAAVLNHLTKTDIACLAAPMLSSIFFMVAARNIAPVTVVRNTALIAVLIAGMLAHTCVFLNHSAVHNFAILKYFTFFAVIFGVCVAISCELCTKERYMKYFLVVFILALVANFSLNLARIYKKDIVDDIEVAYIAKNYNKYNDILFSPVYEIQSNPPMLLSISGKKIYRITNSDSVPSFIQTIDAKKYTAHYIVPESFFTKEELTRIVEHFNGAAIASHDAPQGGAALAIRLPDGVGVKDVALFVDSLLAGRRASPQNQTESPLSAS